jgi:hypothetical protein
MKRWTLLGAVGCLALLAGAVMVGVERMAPPVADASDTFSIWGYIWDDTDVDGVRDVGEGSPEAHPGASVDVNLHICAPGTGTWGCREQAYLGSKSIEANGYYEFTDIPEGDFTVCLDITPPTEWTLTMVREWGAAVDPDRVNLRCITTNVGTGAPPLDWGIAHIASELSVTKVCAPMSLSQGDIECSITATNEGDTILTGAGDDGVIVEDYYLCDDFDLVDATPEPDDYGTDDGYGHCWREWDVGNLMPGGEETIGILLSPKHTSGTAYNCVHAAAWSVIIPGVQGEGLVSAALAGSYDADWEDVVAPDRCVNFGEPETHRRSTSTPVPTATPTEVPPPPPTATIAPPLPTATPYGGPAGVGISPPATGTGLASQGVPNAAWWLASLGALALGLGASVALAFRKTR